MVTATLDLVLAYRWFDKIASGEKRFEYREIKPYWTARLSAKRFNRVRFRRGYTSTTMLFELVSIDKTTGPNDLNLPECYCLTLGKRLDSLMDADLYAAAMAWPNLTASGQDALLKAGFIVHLNSLVVALTPKGQRAIADLQGVA